MTRAERGIPTPPSFKQRTASYMLIDRAEFISRFLYQIRDDEFYGNSGSLPNAETIKQASAAAKDLLGFAAHCAAFTTLAEVIDLCTAEELNSKGSGIAARNASKHPSVIALTKSDSEQRASIAAAAAQGLAWMENCRRWVQDSTLRNQIAKRVMTAILVSVGRVKKGYTSAQLGALAQVGASLRDSDIFVVRARGAIAEILANNISSLPSDGATRSAVRKLIAAVADAPNAQPAIKAVEKLGSLWLHQPIWFVQTDGLPYKQHCP